MPEQNPSTSTAGSLNDKNVNMLRALVLAHVFACAAWVIGMNLADVQNIADVAAKALSLSLLTLASLATIALRNTLPPLWKARLLFGFWYWEHPLPGCRAFSEYLQGDDRIKQQELQDKYRSILQDPARQNEEWYKLYRKYQKDNAYIAYNNRVFLLLQDSAAIILVLLPLIYAALWYADSLHGEGLPLFYVMLVEFLIAWIAARNAGVSLVRDVLALASDDLSEAAAAGQPSPRPARTRRTH